MERISTNPTEYVVFDVETNGLKSKQDDLLSISFYKPDDGKEYSKFLPLELNRSIVTTSINGITKEDLNGATALTQSEFDNIIKEFELDKRTILIYAGRDFDKSFLFEYLKRHQISGFEKLKFYNFKRNIISPKFSNGIISKDNLCAIFKINGVSAVHSGSNDCKLEWKLFEKMDGYYYLVTEGHKFDNVYRINEDYIVPVSLFYSHPNLGRALRERPHLGCQSTLIKSFEINAKGIEKFPTNITGMTIEHLINSMLNVDKQDSAQFLVWNKKKLNFVGKIPNNLICTPMSFNPDGTVTAIQKEDKDIEKRINSTLKNLENKIHPLVDFIKYEIFKNERILSQELVINSDDKILALCDLSNEKTVLEIKTNDSDSSEYKEQFFYEAQGRAIYHLKMEWAKNLQTGLLEKIFFHIFSVYVHIGNLETLNCAEGKREATRRVIITEIENILSSTDLSLVAFINKSTPITLKCKVCGHEWNISHCNLMKKVPTCPICKPKITKKKQNIVSDEDRIKARADKYYEKILQKSNHTIVTINYIGAKEDVEAICIACGHKWKSRADHLLDRCWCPMCKKEKGDINI